MSKPKFIVKEGIIIVDNSDIIPDNMIIIEEPYRMGTTKGKYSQGKQSRLIFSFDDYPMMLNILFDALPDCHHKIKTQASGGIKCIKCGGWYCA